MSRHCKLHAETTELTLQLQASRWDHRVDVSSLLRHGADTVSSMLSQQSRHFNWALYWDHRADTVTELYAETTERTGLYAQTARPRYARKGGRSAYSLVFTMLAMCRRRISQLNMTFQRLYVQTEIWRTPHDIWFQRMTIVSNVKR